MAELVKKKYFYVLCSKTPFPNIKNLLGRNFQDLDYAYYKKGIEAKIVFL